MSTIGSSQTAGAGKYTKWAGKVCGNRVGGSFPTRALLVGRVRLDKQRRFYWKNIDGQLHNRRPGITQRRGRPK
jgi:hypothetical protein